VVVDIPGGGEGSAVVAKEDGLDDVLVLQGELLLPAQTVPYLNRRRLGKA
jgi:hypothetical protein